MSTDPIPAIVVGTGFGCRIQVPALRGAGFAVEALVGTDRARTEARARANGVPAAFTDLDSAIEQTGAMLVAISTPPFTHAELAIGALGKGCHVLCEKPFARDAEEARQMLAVADASGKVHALGNEFRFLPARATVARSIAEGMIGEPRFASLINLSGFVAQFREDFPDWWFDPAQGGGWLGASGSHAVDQVRSWLGEFDAISASMTSIAGYNVEDSFSARFRLENGVEGVIQQSSAAWGGMSEITRIAGSAGSIRIEGARVLFADRSGETEVPIPSDLVLPPASTSGDDPRRSRLDWQIMAEIEIAPYTKLCRSIRAAITGNSPASPVRLATFADGAANMRVMNAIRTSAERRGALVEVGGQ